MDPASPLPHEIASLIISYVDRKDLLAVSLICKSWSHDALDRLWLEIGNDGQGAAKLGVLKRYWDEGTDMYTVECDDTALLGAEDGVTSLPAQYRLHQRWDRFMFYSRRVRFINLTRPSESCPSAPSQAVTIEDLSRLAVSCPFPRAFPGLRELRIELPDDATDSTRYLSLLCCGTLHRLSLSIPWTPTLTKHVYNDLGNSFNDILKLSPHIEDLAIHNIYHRTLQGLEESLSALLPSLSHLRSFTIGFGDLTSRSFTAIAIHPNIIKFEIRPIFVRKTGRSHVIELRSFNLQLLSVLKSLQDPFSSLRSLKLQTRTGGIAALHSSHACFQRLEELFVYSADEITDTQLNAFFGNVALFTGLKRLHIDFLEFTGRFTAQAFTALSRLHQLQALIIEHDVEDGMEDDDLATLVRNNPSLVDLRFIIKGETGTSRRTINALFALSRQSNNLRVLQYPLRLQPQRDELTTLSWKMDNIGVHLKNLERLEVPYPYADARAPAFVDMGYENRLQGLIKSCLGERCARDVLKRMVSR